MTIKPPEALELESELMRLNTLVRERREQIAKMEECPNPDCPCRVVWKDKVEKGLASQMRKIGKKVNGPCGCQTAKAPKKKARSKRKA